MFVSRVIALLKTNRKRSRPRWLDRRLQVEALEDRLCLTSVAPFVYGEIGDIPLMGDWNGDGMRSPGIFRDGVFHLSNANITGVGEIIFAYGLPGDLPVVGDWDGDGVDTVGVVRDASWHLRNSNTTGVAETMFAYGMPGDVPVVGDWDANGVDTPGVVRDGIWYLRMSNTSGVGEIAFAFGLPGDRPGAGDWDGDGESTPGVLRDGVWYLRNANSTGVAEITFSFASPEARPVVVDWGEGRNKVGVVTPENVWRLLGPDPFSQSVQAGPGSDASQAASTVSSAAADEIFAAPDKTITDFPRVDDWSGAMARHVITQADGTILLAGQANGDFALARYDNSGTLDTSFGDGGLR